MSRLMQGRGPGPELLPVLQSLCGQVTQLRMDDATALAEREETMRSGSWWVKVNERFALMSPQIDATAPVSL